MSALSHTRARDYLHAGRQSLGAGERRTLDQHLADCAECRAYAAELTALQAGLSRAMRTRWNALRPPANLERQVQTRILRLAVSRRPLSFVGSLVAKGMLIGLVALLGWTLSVTRPDSPASGLALSIDRAPVRWLGMGTFDDRIALLASQVANVHFMPGGAIDLMLHWQMREMRAGDNIVLYLRDAEGQVFVQADASLAGSACSSGKSWPEDLVATCHTLWLPTDLTPGRYWLEAGMYDAVSGERFNTGRGDPAIRFLRVDVRVPAQPLAVKFGDAATLLGVDLPATPFAPGESVDMTLFWQTPAVTTTTYTTFMQLRDEDGQLALEGSLVVLGSDESWPPLRPTSVYQNLRFRLPTNLTNGRYQLYVGLHASPPGVALPYDLKKTGIRLQTDQGAETVWLATIEVRRSAPVREVGLEE